MSAGHPSCSLTQEEFEPPKAPDLPPREVPQGLSAAEYYNLGLRYKRLGWIELARTALTLAVQDDGEGTIGKAAKRYLETKIPRLPVSPEMQRQNIIGFNHMHGDNLPAAQEVFEQLIAEHPDFEWAYGNLALVYLKNGEVARAKEVLEKVLAMNPLYLNGWLHLARAKRQEGDIAGAIACVATALVADPDDPPALAMKADLEKAGKTA